MHNVLKNIRALSTDSADRLMQALDIRVSDLLWSHEPAGSARVRAIPVIRSRIGPGVTTSLSEIRGYMPMPDWLVQGLVDPLAARLASDLVLPEAVAAHDLVLLDQNPVARSDPGGNGPWVVAEAAGLRVRYVRVADSRLYVANQVTLRDPPRWQSISLHGRNILDVVRARIVWIGREMEKTPARPAEPPG
jgi:hypothetical protein